MMTDDGQNKNTHYYKINTYPSLIVSQNLKYAYCFNIKCILNMYITYIFIYCNIQLMHDIVNCIKYIFTQFLV